ncbi:MAG TPA: hypothetical protein VFB56_08895 [Nitrospiraceae bacterium]|nr:hypothetical protein [Nitrospiraceae bacterium]
MPLKNLYLTIAVGQSVRDFLILGTAGRLVDLLPNFRIVLLSPSYKVPDFLEQCPKHERVVVCRMELPVGGPNWRLIHWRRKVHNRLLTSLMLQWEARRSRLPGYLSRMFEELPPSLVVSSHPMLYHDYEVVTWARRLGIQTLGVVKSWDNIQKGLSSHCHLLSVWNPVNRDEAVQLLEYRPDEVEMNGALSFDAYYHPAYEVAREEALASMGLDPSRRLITLATCGVLDKEFYGRDETHLVEDLLRMIRESPVLKGSQLMIRLHPTSHLECFWKYWNRPDIKISFASVMPGTMWCPNQQDLLEQTNLLRHSDVIVTPGSSWALEAAILDTPTVVPVYSDFQPDHAAAQFQRWTLARHYKRLVENDWVPITRSYDETKTAIEDALVDPARYAAGRSAIVDQYVYYRDSGSSRRVANWIADIARCTIAGAPRGF